MVNSQSKLSNPKSKELWQPEKDNVKRTTTVKTRRRQNERRGGNLVRTDKKRDTGNVFNFFVPLVFILSILVVPGLFAFKGYRTVTASSFFDVKKIEVRGISRVSREDIEKIVRSAGREQRGLECRA